jgi:hypothetical protein
MIECALGGNGARCCGGVKLVQSHKASGSAAGAGRVAVVLLVVVRVAETLR